MNFSICYVSKASKYLTASNLEDILKKTEYYNNKNNISGILLYSSGHFFQILEGEEELLMDLFCNKIMNDERHKDIYVILQKRSKIPFFKGYSSKFSASSQEIEIEQLKNYIEKNDIQDNPDKFRRILIPYLTTTLTSS